MVFSGMSSLSVLLTVCIISLVSAGYHRGYPCAGPQCDGGVILSSGYRVPPGPQPQPPSPTFGPITATARSWTDFPEHPVPNNQGYDTYARQYPSGYGGSYVQPGSQDSVDGNIYDVTEASSSATSIALLSTIVPLMMLR